MIPETAVQNSCIATVVGKGPEVGEWLAVGDRVFMDAFGHYILEDADPAMRGLVLVSERTIKARIKVIGAAEKETK